MTVYTDMSVFVLYTLLFCNSYNVVSFPVLKNTWRMMMPGTIEITDYNDPRLDVFARLNETQLRHYYEPNGGLFIAESPKVTERALNAGCRPVTALIEHSQINAEAKSVLIRLGDIPIFTGESGDIRKLTNIPMTRGLLTCFERPSLPTVEEICKGKRRIAVLENVTNPTNVGAIFRSAAALGMEAVLLNAACSDPFYRRASRVSMGTVFQVPWTYLENTEESGRKPTRLERWQNTMNGESVDETDSEESGYKKAGYVERLREIGFRTAAMALTDRSVGIDDARVCAEERLAVILGAEGDGLRQETIDASDYTVKIPMSNGVDSLNVAAASAVAFWQLGRFRP